MMEVDLSKTPPGASGDMRAISIMFSDEDKRLISDHVAKLNEENPEGRPATRHNFCKQLILAEVMGQSG